MLESVLVITNYDNNNDDDNNDDNNSDDHECYYHHLQAKENCCKGCVTQKLTMCTFCMGCMQAADACSEDEEGGRCMVHLPS